MSDKVQVGIPVISLTIDGKSDPAIEKALEQCIVDTTFSLPSMATIRIHDPMGKWANSDTFQPGKSLVIKMAPSESMQKVDIGQVFTGEIVAIEPSFSVTGKGTLTIRGYDLSHRLHYGTKSYVFLNMTNSAIANEVIGRTTAISKGSMDSASGPNEYVLQNNLTDFEFLSMRAKRTGCILAMVDGKLCFDTPDKLIVDGPKLTMRDNLRQFAVRVSTALQAKQVEVVGWDFTTKKPITSLEDPATLWTSNGIGKTGAAVTASGFGDNGKSSLTTFAPQTQAEADALAKSAAGDQEGEFIEADGVSFGDPRLVAGVKVQVAEVGDKFDGKYFVTSATHIYNTTGYQVHFTISGRFPQTFNQLLNPSASGLHEPGSISNVVIGIVTNNDDPKNMGRVKVKFPWMVGYKADIDSNWARVAAPGAGKARGVFYIPEVNDEVLVAFEHGNPNLPYVLGGLWNGVDETPEKKEEALKNKEVIHRMIVSRTGHKIVLDDTQGQESILIMDKTKKQSILIESATGNITIKGDGDLLIDMKGNITVKSGRIIDIEAISDIKMKGVNLTAEASANYKVDAKVELEMKATGFANFQSTTALAIKGPTLDIEASGPASIQGNPIMLN